MTVGIIGSGSVGRALGRGFASRGHAVRLGTREPGRPELRQWAAETRGDTTVVSNAAAASTGEILVLATGWDGTEHALHLAGPEHFAGKVVIDVTNPLDFSRGMPPRLAVSGEDSSGERVQRWLPDARVVKAFNTVGAEHMVDPDLPGGPPTMFLAGDDERARAAVRAICEDFGWEVVDLGPMTASRYLDGLAMVWILHAVRNGARGHAFKLLHP